MMTCSVRRLALVLPLLLGGFAASVLSALDPQADAAPAEQTGGREALPSIAAKTAGMERHDGFLPLYLDARTGTAWLELPPPGARGVTVSALYVEGLRRGLGSNPVGLDRGQLGAARLIEIRRVGPRVLFEQPNFKFRARTGNEAELRATAESFATSVIWGHTIGALDDDGRSLVDISGFVVRDAHNVVATLAATEQGEFSLDPNRSAVELDDCLVFPDNLELEATLTFAGKKPGDHVQATAPTPQAVTLVQHHSLIRLPDDDFTPRRFDPRQGMYSVDFLDYAAGLDEPVRWQWIARHRLKRVDPHAARSRVEEPIVYYVDRGAPEPVRSALLDGARWWAEAFEAAGLIDAYRVELLPEGAHPLDVRYNVIQWVHRSTRGWSYGNAIIDPRTGEIVKGHVSLGSLRVRQDRLLFEGLAGTAKTGTGSADDPIELALARIRQLSAHEVGHTLGITHNFAASTYGGRASVMDYPAPLVRLGEDGNLDFSEAYGVGLGAWDIHTVRYGYSEVPPGGDEAAMLATIVRQGIDENWLFLSDADARPPSAADPRANLWDNGDDPVTALQETLAVRRHALDRFGAHNLPAGRPISELQEVLVPVYFHHRYQLDAAAKVVGGMTYHYAIRDDGQTPTAVVAADQQRRALAVISEILQPETLAIPPAVVELMAPRTWEAQANREMFGTGTWPAFDTLGAAATAADHVVASLLEPQRLARVDAFARRDPALPDVEEVYTALLSRAFEERTVSDELAAIRDVTQRVLVERTIGLVSAATTAPRVRAHLETGLATIIGRLAGREDAHGIVLRRDIQRFLNRTHAGMPVIHEALPPPPGSPIGMPPIFDACHAGPEPAAGPRARAWR